jgi:spore coat polysaccharide biosynthesis protein SpsF
LPIGFADHIDAEHTLARYWPLVALGAGMDVLEKHLTLNRADKKEDYISALNPSEFKAMVADLRLAEAGLGQSDFDFAEAEAEYREGFRKRVVSTRPIDRGAVIGDADVTLKRGGKGGFWDLRDVIGLTTAGSVPINVPLSEDLLVPRTKRLRLVATLACRAGGSRLYGKPVQRIGDRTILEYLVARIQSIPRVDQIVLAISEGSENTLFIDYANKLGIDYVIGDEWDVQERLIVAGERVNADLLLRATTESPFLYTDNVEELVERHIAEGAALSVTEGLPDGAYCEIISLDALKDAHARGERRHRSELCTLYMFEHPERYKHLTLKAPPKLSRAGDIRLTVDYPEDLIVCRKIAEELGRGGPLFSLEAIVDFLDAHPKLNAVNNWIVAGQSRIWA